MNYEGIIEKRAEELANKHEYFPLRKKVIKDLLIEGWDLYDSVLDSEEKKRIKEIDNEKEKLIETMKGTEVRVGAEWLEDNNPYLLEKIYNSSYFTRGLDYKPHKYDILVQLNFTDTGICIKATHKGVSFLLDEQTWWTDSYDDWTLERLKSYRLGY